MSAVFFSVTDFDNVPSLLFVAKAFETPAICAALVSIVLYVIKIALLIKRPDTKRLHLKAAYLTFGAIAGTSVVTWLTKTFDRSVILLLRQRPDLSKNLLTYFLVLPRLENVLSSPFVCFDWFPGRLVNRLCSLMLQF